MNKLFTIITTIALIFWIPFSAFGGIGIYVNNKRIQTDQEAYIKDNRIFVPLRFVSEAIGCKLFWGYPTAVLGKNNKITKIEIGDKNATVDGVVKSIDEAPEITNGRAMVPLRFISEALGAKVKWTPPNRVDIYTFDPVRPQPIGTVKEIMPSWVNNIRPRVAPDRLVYQPKKLPFHDPGDGVSFGPISIYDAKYEKHNGKWCIVITVSEYEDYSFHYVTKDGVYGCYDDESDYYTSEGKVTIYAKLVTKRGDTSPEYVDKVYFDDYNGLIELPVQ